mmetsp:Transcript_17631/g.43045  ORF Transcript_17631/g.43045 Transcript_17631/m.43045 type:complete len:85 (+) Transcript_17631:731-985(+)
MTAPQTTTAVVAMASQPRKWTLGSVIDTYINIKVGDGNNICDLNFKGRMAVLARGRPASSGRLLDGRFSKRKDHGKRLPSRSRL